MPGDRSAAELERFLAERAELTSRGNSPLSETIWVSPGTYLPVRVAVRSALGAPALRQTADITWLPPTAQNLAELSVPIPAGFRRVPLVRAVLSILQQIPGPPPAKPKLLCLPPAGRACKHGPALPAPARSMLAAHHLPDVLLPYEQAPKSS